MRLVRSLQSKGALGEGKDPRLAKNLKLEDEKSSMKNCSSYYLVIMKLDRMSHLYGWWLMAGLCVFFYHKS